MSKQQEYTKKLIELIQENPELPVVPMVDNDLFSDDHSWIMGCWGNAEVDEYWVDQERVYFKSRDIEDLVDKAMDIDNTLTEQTAGEIIDEFSWVKCITVKIGM